MFGGRSSNEDVAGDCAPSSDPRTRYKVGRVMWHRNHALVLYPDRAWDRLMGLSFDAVPPYIATCACQRFF